MTAARSRASAAALLLAVALLVCCSLPAPATAQNPPKLRHRHIVSNRTTGRRTVYYHMRITLGRGAPDCVSREVILVNGLFQPTIEARTNDTLVITVINDLPRSFPQTSAGLTIHWHGLYMWGEAAWFDGTSYATQCPIATGTNFTYRFLVDEAEGTYLWHDHATANRANGLQGAFIVSNPGVESPFPKTEADHIMFLGDWYHDEGNVMAMRLNRPANASMANNVTGLYQAVPAADSLLINGRGRYDDCSSNSSLAFRGENGVLSPRCDPQRNPVVGLDVDRVTSGCSHNVFYVAPGETYKFRLINAATQVYMSVCFENHTVTMVGADATPTSMEDIIYPSCIDINSGQRYDLLLTADQDVPPGTSFWISVHSQFRPMSPSAYAILQYTQPLQAQNPEDRRLLREQPASHPRRLLELDLSSTTSSASRSVDHGSSRAQRQQQQLQHERQELAASLSGQGLEGREHLRRSLRQYPYSGGSTGYGGNNFPRPSTQALFPPTPPNVPPSPPPPPRPSPPPPRPPAPPLPAARWPNSPSPQPGVVPWTSAELNQVFTHDGVLGYLDNYDFQPFWQQFSHVGGEQYFSGVLFFPANQTITVNLTAPLMTETGMVRWVMNNVAMPVNPPCSALMRDIAVTPGWLGRNTLNTSNMNHLNMANRVAAADSASPDGGVSKHSQPSVYINGQPAPTIPIVGKHVAIVQRNEIVDIVINNRPGNEGNPGVNGGPVAMVQHPMHMHGHKFWVLGVGSGVYNASIHSRLLNQYNPIFRDTLTLPVGSWAVLRFTANNPGLWPFHCHIMWHSFMGQQMYLLEAIDQWPKPPRNFPRCNTNCLYNFANYSTPYINNTYGNSSTSRHQLP